MKNKKGLEIPAVPAVLLSIISFQGGAALAKGIFPVLGAVATSALRIVLSAINLVIFNWPNIRNLTRAQWKAVALYGLTLGALSGLVFLHEYLSLYEWLAVNWIFPCKWLAFYEIVIVSSPYLRASRE
jgi:threonine/homoserine efflux transporter RhtA